MDNQEPPSSPQGGGSTMGAGTILQGVRIGSRVMWQEGVTYGELGVVSSGKDRREEHPRPKSRRVVACLRGPPGDANTSVRTGQRWAETKPLQCKR